MLSELLEQVMQEVLQGDPQSVIDARVDDHTTPACQHNLHPTRRRNRTC